MRARLRPPVPRVPQRADVIVAAVFGVVTAVEALAAGAGPVGAVCNVAAATALAWRRVFVLVAPLVALLGVAVQPWLGVELQETTSPIAIVGFAAYSLGTVRDRRAAPAGIVALVLVCLAVLGDWGVVTWGDLVFATIITGGPWALGRVVAHRTHEAGTARDRARQLELEAEHAAHIATMEERARIARELHDLLAHSVSVMVVHAGAAEQVLPRDPAQAAASMRTVQETGRRALEETKALLGLLREPGATSALCPQPGLSDLDSLVSHYQQAGLVVELSVTGRQTSLPAGAELSAYRIVQEALTNVLKHSGQGAARVSLRYGNDDLTVEIADDGTPHPQPGEAGPPGRGHGLIGMRERVEMFGGELEAAPVTTGGFRVRARLPLREPVLR